MTNYTPEAAQRPGTHCHPARGRRHLSFLVSFHSKSPETGQDKAGPGLREVRGIVWDRVKLESFMVIWCHLKCPVVRIFFCVLCPLELSGPQRNRKLSSLTHSNFLRKDQPLEPCGFPSMSLYLVKLHALRPCLTLLELLLVWAGVSCQMLCPLRSLLVHSPQPYTCVLFCIEQ